MKSTIFDGIKERLADIKRSEGREPIIEQAAREKTPQEIIQEAFERLDDIPIREMVGPVGFCSVYGHNIGLTGLCVRCGLKPRNSLA